VLRGGKTNSVDVAYNRGPTCMRTIESKLLNGVNDEFGHSGRLEQSRRGAPSVRIPADQSLRDAHASARRDHICLKRVKTFRPRGSVKSLTLHEGALSA